MPSIDEPTRSTTYWRSLAELAGSREFQLGSRPSSRPRPAGSDPPTLAATDGRIAGSGRHAGCRWEKREILPFASGREPRPGRARAIRHGDGPRRRATGLSGHRLEGRPIKIEGNPIHPQSRGPPSLRSGGNPRNSTIRTAARLSTAKRECASKRSSGATSPTLRQSTLPSSASPAGPGCESWPKRAVSRRWPRCGRVREDYPQAQWYQYEPISTDNERAGSELALGHAYRTHVVLDKARVIVCLDADPLAGHSASVRYAHDFARGREAERGNESALLRGERSRRDRERRRPSAPNPLRQIAGRSSRPWSRKSPAISQPAQHRPRARSATEPRFSGPGFPQAMAADLGGILEMVS